LSSWKLSTESSSPHRCVPSIYSESQFWGQWYPTSATRSNIRLPSTIWNTFQ
jgi:hypothetical protein